MSNPFEDESGIGSPVGDGSKAESLLDLDLPVTADLLSDVFPRTLDLDDGGGAGIISALQGSVFAVYPDGKRTELSENNTITVGSSIETGAGAKIAIVLVDGTLLSLNENSRIFFDQFEFDTATLTGKLIVQIEYGLLIFFIDTCSRWGYRLRLRPP